MGCHGKSCPIGYRETLPDRKIQLDRVRESGIIRACRNFAACHRKDREMKYLVRQFFAVEVEVEANDPSHAREIAGFHETAYEIETRFVDSNQIGGPDISRAGMEDEVLPLEEA